jgi:hypothetical protein
MQRSTPLALSALALIGGAQLLGAQVRSGAAPAAAAVLAPAAMPAGHYEFTSTDDDGDVTSGAVSWNGQQLRIDVDRNRNRNTAHAGTGRAAVDVAPGNRRGEYMLVDFATNTVRQVKPAEREISEMPLATFEQIIGKALGMVGSVVQMQVRDAGIIARSVGPGGEIAGVPTQQFRMIEEYNVRVGVFGMNAEEKHHRVVTDYWVPTLAAVPRNPMFELLMRSASAVAQQDVTHQRNLNRARAALFTGAPMKAVVTVTEAGESAKRSMIEITSLTSATPDAALFVMPAGYRIKKHDLSFSL